VGHLAPAEPSRYPRTARRATPPGFATARWHDLTEPTEKAMRDFLAGEQPPLGLHVFVPHFPAKASNLLRNLAENRARLIQALHTVDAAPFAQRQQRRSCSRRRSSSPRRY
jgi:hypothetical protein